MSVVVSGHICQQLLLADLGPWWLLNVVSVMCMCVSLYFSERKLKYASRLAKQLQVKIINM